MTAAHRVEFDGGFLAETLVPLGNSRESSGFERFRCDFVGPRIPDPRIRETLEQEKSGNYLGRVFVFCVGLGAGQ